MSPFPRHCPFPDNSASTFLEKCMKEYNKVVFKFPLPLQKNWGLIFENMTSDMLKLFYYFSTHDIKYPYTYKICNVHNLISS